MTNSPYRRERYVAVSTVCICEVNPHTINQPMIIIELLWMSFFNVVDGDGCDYENITNLCIFSIYRKF